ncbi:MAG: S9 family peptidase [Acidobacteriaceae bacterium]|nr:S9 family peptidase [Acidobacteriaceae bacterium]
MGLQAQQPPAAVKRPVTDMYHGVAVVDNYRWLEDSSNAEVKNWVAEENRYTREVLGRLPNRETLRTELSAAFQKRGIVYNQLQWVGGKLFGLRFSPGRQQPELVVFPSFESEAADVVFDPQKMGANGQVSIDFFQPSHDGRLVAVSLSRLGSESGDVHVFETGTGREMPDDVIPRVNNGTAAGSVAWNGENTGLYYTRYPRGDERPPADRDFYQQIYFHKLGTPTADDQYEAGRDFPRIAEVQLEATDNGQYIVATVENGDGGDYFHLLRTKKGWAQITRYADQISSVRFGSDNSLYLISKQGAPMGRLLRLANPSEPISAAHTIVGESGVAITEVAATTDRVYVTDLVGGPSQIRTFTLEGKFLGIVPLEGVVSVSELVRAGERVLFTQRGYIQSTRRFLLSGQLNTPKLIPALSPPPTIRYDDAEVIRDFAVSKDGTRVPLNIIRRKGVKLDGSHPVLMTGYGGYGISMTPSSNVTFRILLDRGFVLVDTNLRGGSEFGEKWHLAGNLAHKQNVFDDFYACAQYMVSRHYTTPERFAIMGGSNGGLLMGAALTQHPEMFRAVIAFVGIYDMLRVELSPNGAFNVTEFGTVKEGSQFQALFAYSPYHHVTDDKTYPAAIFLTGDNDPRVDPANSRKMVARLQAVGRSKGPILLRTTSEAGHGIGTALSETVAQYTDALSFMFDQLSVK